MGKVARGHLRREVRLRTSAGVVISGPECPTATPGRIALPAMYVVALKTGGPYARYQLGGIFLKAQSSADVAFFGGVVAPLRLVAATREMRRPVPQRGNCAEILYASK